MESGCILWGSRVIVLKVGKERSSTCNMPLSRLRGSEITLVAQNGPARRRICQLLGYVFQKAPLHPCLANIALSFCILLVEVAEDTIPTPIHLECASTSKKNHFPKTVQSIPHEYVTNDVLAIPTGVKVLSEIHI